MIISSEIENVEKVENLRNCVTRNIEFVAKGWMEKKSILRAFARTRAKNKLHAPSLNHQKEH